MSGDTDSSPPARRIRWAGLLWRVFAVEVLTYFREVVVIDGINCPRLLQTEAIGMFPIDGVVALVWISEAPIQNLPIRLP